MRRDNLKCSVDELKGLLDEAKGALAGALLEAEVSSDRAFGRLLTLPRAREGQIGGLVAGSARRICGGS